MYGTGQIYSFRPYLIAGEKSIYRQDATSLPSLGKTVLAKKLANQLEYGNIIAGEKNEFYGYEGMGYGGNPRSSQNFLSWKEFTVPIYIVPPNHPRIKLYLVEEEGHTGGPEETLRTGELNEKLQKSYESVPLPLVSQIPHKQIQSLGSDGSLVILSYATNERWEIHRLGIFKQGPYQGLWKFGYGSYNSKASEWNGIRGSGTGTSIGTLSASALSLADGVISLGDLVRVQRGEKLGHAIGIAVYVRSNEHLAPAKENDHGENEFHFLEDGTTPNPAYGNIDGVPEGLWCRFPTSSKASEFGMTYKLEIAIYEAIREHGLVVRDGGGGTNWLIGDLRTIYTPYCDTRIFPFAGSKSFLTKYHNYASFEGEVKEIITKGWVDSSLPELENDLNGISGVLAKMPWRTLEQLEPRTG